MTNRFASSAYDPTSAPIDPLSYPNIDGTVREMQSNIQLPIGATAGDTVVFGEIPSDAKIDVGSKLYNGALTGVTSFDVGLYQRLNGTPMMPDTVTPKGSANCLIAAKDVHLASNQDCSGQITPDLGGKYAWELAGLTADPGTPLVVVGTIHAAGGTATAAAWLDMHVKWRSTN